MKRTGFTLVEIIVVLAIISILAAILVPAIQEAKKKADDKQKVTEVVQQDSVKGLVDRAAEHLWQYKSFAKKGEFEKALHELNGLELCIKALQDKDLPNNP